MSSVYSRALQVQARSIWAIALREVLVKHGRFKLGYAWELIRAVFMVASFWLIREVAGFKAPNGLPVPVFLLMGFIPWFTFQEIINRSISVVRTNRSMLAYPQVTELDLYLAASLVAWTTQMLIMVLFLVVLWLLDYSFPCLNPIAFGLGVLGVAVFALALGLVLGSLRMYVPALERIVPMVLRILFFTSGVFFSPERFAKQIGDIFMWNPLVNFIELLRSTFILTKIPDNIKLDYIVVLTVVLLCLGMLLERHVRKMTEQV